MNFTDYTSSTPPPAGRRWRRTSCRPRSRSPRRRACGCCSTAATRWMPRSAPRSRSRRRADLERHRQSDLFAIIWDGNGLARPERVGPLAGRLDAGILRRPEDGAGARLEQRVGAGRVSAWAELSERFGQLPFEKLFEPAIEYAYNGYLVSPFVAQRWALQVPELKSQPGFAAGVPARRPRAAGGRASSRFATRRRRSS